MAADKKSAGITDIVPIHPFHFITGISGPLVFEGTHSRPQMGNLMEAEERLEPHQSDSSSASRNVGAAEDTSSVPEFCCSW